MAPSLVSPKFLLGSFILFISLYIRQVTARATDVAFAGTPQTCTPITISWANGAPPFQVTISSLGEGQTTGRAVQIIQSGNSRLTQWVPNLPGGTRVFATVLDNQQEFANSNLFTITTSNNQSCLPPGSATPTQNPSPNQRTRISPVVPILLTILTIALIAGIIFHTCRRMRRYTPAAPESKLEWGQGGKEYSPPKNLANMSGWRYRWELFWLTLRRDMILLKNRVGKWGKKGADSAPAQSNGDQDLRTSAEMARTIMDKDVADTTRNNTIISRQPTDLTAPTSPAAGFGPRTTAINFGNEPSPPEPSPLTAAVFTASVVRTEKPAIQQAPAAKMIPPPIRVPVRYDSEATPKPLTTPKRIGLPSAGDRLANMRPIKPGRSRSSVAPSVSRRASSVPPKRASTVTGRAPRSPDTSVARSPTLVGSPASPRAPVQVQTLSIKRRSRSVGTLEPSHSNTAPLDIPEDSVSSDQEDNVNPFQDIPFRNSSPSASSFGIPRSPTATEVGLEEGTYFAALPTASTQYRFSRALPDSAHLVPPLTWTATDVVPPFPLPGGSPMMTSRTLPAKRTSVASTVASEALERSRSAAAPSAYKRSRSRSRDARRMKGRSEISRGSTITEAEESSGESVRSRVPPMPKKNVSANRF